MFAPSMPKAYSHRHANPLAHSHSHAIQSAQREFIEACRNGRSSTAKRASHILRIDMCPSTHSSRAVTVCVQLIRARADINAHDDRQSTPLMHATWFGHYGTVKVGPDPLAIGLPSRSIVCAMEQVLIESKADMTVCAATKK